MNLSRAPSPSPARPPRSSRAVPCPRTRSRSAFARGLSRRRRRGDRAVRERYARIGTADRGGLAPPSHSRRNALGRGARGACMNSPSVSTCLSRRVIDVAAVRRARPALRRRSRPQRQSRADKARARQRSSVARWRAARGNSVAILSPARYSLAAHDLRSCLSADGGVRRVYAPNLAIHASPRVFARALRDLRPPENLPGVRERFSRTKIIWAFRHKARRPPMSISHGSCCG